MSPFLSSPPRSELEEAAELLSALVALPSITVQTGQLPPDRLHGEAAVVEFLRGWLQERGVASETVEVEPQRPQLTARIGSGRPELVLTSHTDTVPPAGWTVDPFLPVRKGDRISGLGACDDKAGLTAMLLAFARIAAGGGPPRGTLTFVGMMGEETFGIGSRWLTGQGYRPDAAVVGEPTELRAVRVECGNVRWRIRTRGRAGHGSRPWEGENAVYRMARVLRVLDDEAAPAIQSRSHPLIGPAALNVGVIAGGEAVNIVPDWCEIQVERRILPGEHPLREMEAVNALLADRLGTDWLEPAPPTSWNHPLETSAEEPVVRCLCAALKERGLDPEPGGVSFGSDANRFAEAGVPCVLFGPGSIRVVHQPDEWVELAEVASAARVLESMALRFLDAVE